MLLIRHLRALARNGSSVRCRSWNGSGRHCQLSRPLYARCVGGAAARVGGSFARLLCCAALTERGRKRRPGSVKLTMPPDRRLVYAGPAGPA